MNQVQTEMFEEAPRDVTQKELDDLVADMAAAQAKYDNLKAESTEAYHAYEKLRAQLVDTLRATGKKKYHVDGIGTVSVTEKLKVTTPKTPEDKSRFFAWLNLKWGREGFLSYTGINYQTLQKLYNDEFKEAKENGTAADFNIPGVGDPVAEFGLKFNKN